MYMSPLSGEIIDTVVNLGHETNFTLNNIFIQINATFQSHEKGLMYLSP